MKKLLQFIGFFGLGALILGLVFRNQNTAYQEQCRLDGIPTDQCNLFDKLWQDFSSIDAWWITAVMVAFTISNVLRALRWQMLIRPLGHSVHFHNSFLTILLGYFANLGLPRMGEVVRAGTLSRYEGISLERVMGTMVTDRLMDFACLLGVIAIAFFVESDTILMFIEQRQQSGKGGLNWLIWLLLGGSALGFGLLYYWRQALLQLPFVQKTMTLAKGFWVGMSTVRQVESPVLFVLYSVGIWLMFYVQCMFNMWAFPPTAHLGWEPALMVFVLGTLGFVIPSPGGMGTFHALCIAALALYNVVGSDAFSYANIAFFSVQIFYNVIAGVLSIILLPILNRKKSP
jgi:glycosyltransferase 2 family protein